MRAPNFEHSSRQAWLRASCRARWFVRGIDTAVALPTENCGSKGYPANTFNVADQHGASVPRMCISPALEKGMRMAVRLVPLKTSPYRRSEPWTRSTGLKSLYFGTPPHLPLRMLLTTEYLSRSKPCRCLRSGAPGADRGLRNCRNLSLFGRSVSHCGD